MANTNNRALKEWAISCSAVRDGRQTLLIRKGGIREDHGVFRIDDPEFLLMPTFEHQNSRLLQPAFVSELDRFAESSAGQAHVVVDTFARVDSVVVARDEEQVNALSDMHIWNETFVKMRFDYNPYDPLYLLLIRAHRLREAAVVPLLPEYIGCRSWVTLETPICVDGAEPAISDSEFTALRDAFLRRIQSPESALQRS